jgi:quercetin dioxygenase-like cupin family protein
MRWLQPLKINYFYMARKGQTIFNKATSEKITWIETSKDTNGKYLRFDLEVAPGKKVAVRHVHPHQDETFKIKNGELKLEINGETNIYRSGDTVTIPKGNPHEWWNVSAAEAVTVEVTFAPALKSEIFFEQFFGLAQDEKTDAKGSPSFMQIMAMCNEYKVYIAGPPVFIQRLMGFVLGGIARISGRKKFYPQYSN